MTILKICVKLNTQGHRIVFNFLVNLLAGLAAYTYLPKKFACAAPNSISRILRFII
jgi:hypothetical protein